MGKIKIVGITELKDKLKSNISLGDVKRVVKHNGAQLQSKTMRNADFDKGYQTGTTKRSIALTIKDAGLTAEVEPTTEYAPYLEYGTRYMEAQPFVKPAYDKQKEKFKKDMQKLVK